MITVKRCSYLKLAFSYGNKYCPKEISRILIRTLLEQKRNIIFIAVDDNKTVGFAAARRLPGKYVFDKGNQASGFMVGPIRVEEDYRKCGIGQNLLNGITEYLESFKNAEAVYAYIGLANIPSQKLFSKCGFENVGYMVKDKNKFYLKQEKSGFYLFKRNNIVNEEQ